MRWTQWLRGRDGLATWSHRKLRVGVIDNNANAVREALIWMGALWDVVVETTAGYRERLLAAGFSTAAAEEMSVDFHRTLIVKFND